MQVKFRRGLNQKLIANRTISQVSVRHLNIFFLFVTMKMAHAVE